MSNAVREKLRLDGGWRFHLGEIPSPVPNTHIAAYMNNKAGWSRGAARANFDDSDWRIVDLLHDWSVEGKFDPANHVDSGFLPRGIAWYRRHFRLEPADRGKYLALQFDGVATYCTVYVNGHLLHRNFCGYTPFTIDITDIANFGDELNVLSVRVDATYMEGWWYEGAGIYRHTWLTRTWPVHVAPNGIFVHPTRTFDAQWSTEIETKIENTSNEAARCEVSHEIRQAHGSAVGQTSCAIEIAAHSSKIIHQTIPISNPDLWSCQSPTLHHLHTEIRRDGILLDDMSTRFGYRTIRFDPDEGFFLNDQPVKLKGTCNHQDHAGVGVAVPDSIHRFRIQRLREMGSNAYRCAHNPPAPELLDACDELGMLVMDEARNFGSSPEYLSQLQTMIRRDRNHPSVILWSICNEEAIQGTPAGAAIARTMQDAVKQLDPGRPVMASVSGGILNDDCIADSIEVMGINYQPATYEPYHAKHPKTPLIASETHGALSTRGTYQTDAEKRVFDSYDLEHVAWGTTARKAWQAVQSRPFVAGLFAWTGFDYRGEPSPHAWPCVNSHWGILDTCGFAKDSFFLHKAFFSREPFVHLLPHWNWAGREGQIIRVMAYTNCQSAELFLNGESLGMQNVDPIDMAGWNVPYKPGQLRLVGYNHRAPVTETIVETTEEAVALGLEIHPSMSDAPVPADGEFALPITAFALDSAGRRVPTAEPFASFQISGPAKILGVSNGDPSCHEPDKASARSLFRGLAQVIIQTTATPGEIVLTATSPGLQSAELRIAAIAATIRPALPPARVRHFISDWRRSPVTAIRPDPNAVIADTDMNSWERFNPATVPKSPGDPLAGYSIYRATFSIPRIFQKTGGRILFPKIGAPFTAYINGKEIQAKNPASASPIEIPFGPTDQKLTLSLLVDVRSTLPALAGLVELVPL